MVIDRLKELAGVGGSLTAGVDLERATDDEGEYYVPAVAVEWTHDATECAYYVYAATPATADLEEFGGPGVSVAHGFETDAGDPRRLSVRPDPDAFGTAVHRARGEGYPDGDPRLRIGDEPAELTVGLAVAVGYEDKHRTSLLLELGDEDGLAATASAGTVVETTREF